MYHEFDQIDKLETDLPKIWSQPGPVFVNLRIAQADEPPPDRWGGFPYPYLQESLATSTHKLTKKHLKIRKIQLFSRRK